MIYENDKTGGLFFFAGRGPPKVVKFHMDTQNDAICEAGDAFSPSIFGESIDQFFRVVKFLAKNRFLR